MSSSNQNHDPVTAQAIASLLATLDLPRLPNSLSLCPPQSDPQSPLPPSSLNQPAISDNLPAHLWLNSSQPGSHPPLHPHHQNRPPAQAPPQPTRSGRIPQRPDPNNDSLNPLDFIDFPTDSESDDPDFLPPPELFASSSARHSPRPQPSASEPRSFSAYPPARWSQDGLPEPPQSTTDTFPKTCQQPSPRLQPKPASLELMEFDFSTLSDHQPWAGLSPLPPKPPSRHTQRAPVSGSSVTLVSTAEAPADKRSPLTEASLAGVPFVNIPLPDSDDSPEFIPPPPKRTRRDPSRHHDPATRTDPVLPPARPFKSHTQPDAPERASARLPYALSSRYVPIAPCANYSSAVEGGSGQAHSPDSIDDSDHGSSVCGKPKVGSNSEGPARAKPGPKPRPKRDMDQLQKELFKRKKREGMRAVRERKKEYIEELEDRCLALAEENAQLREENEQLMRESRETWRARALGYTPSGPGSTSGGGGLQKENSVGGAARRTVLKTGALASRGRTVLDVIARQGRNGSVSSAKNPGR